MSMAKGKDRKNRKVVKISALYKDSKSKGRFCPKCGTGVFMADHKNRYSCGKCGFTEFKKQ